MLFILFLIVAIIGIVLGFYLNNAVCSEAPALLSMFIGVVSLIAAVIMLIVIICANTGVNGQIASMQEEYKTLKYELESPEARDEFGIVNKDIVEAVGDWNKKIVSNKANQKDFWIGILIPNIYDEFETIELK